MVERRPGPERRARALMGVVAASALAYPLLVCAVQLVFVQMGSAQGLTVDLGAIVGWLALALLCSVALVAVVRWGAARRVRSVWLFAGLGPPVLFELWLVWPALTA